jgi:26S proteasome non-ATPase regulatory subunit 10
MQEPTIYDLAYRGKTAAVKILLNENEKLKTQTDNVRIASQNYIAHYDVFVRLCVLLLQNSRMLIHWAALGGHDDLVRYLLSLDVPVDPVDDVRKHHSLLASITHLDQ